MALKYRVLSSIGVLAILAGAPFAYAQPFSQGALNHLEVGKPAPAFALKGADGQTHKLSDYRGKVVVLEWTSPVCPFTALKYRDGGMQALQADAAKKGVVWLTINTSAPGKPGYLTPATAKVHLAKLKSKPRAFLFDDGKVGRLYGARVTPSAWIIGKDGKLLFQGAVDDDQLARGEQTVSYIAEGLADVRAGKPVRTPFVRPYGCAVEY